MTEELVADGVGVTSGTGSQAITDKRALRARVGAVVNDLVTSASREVLKGHALELKRPLEGSSQNDTAIGSVNTSLTRELDFLGNDSSLEVNIREHGDVGRNGDSLGEGDLDGDQVLQVTLNSGATETGELLSVLDSDDGAVGGEARLDVVVLVPTALESSTPRDGSSVGLNARVGIVGRSEGGAGNLNLLVPEVTRVAAAVLTRVGSKRGIADEHLSASTTLNQGRLDVEDQTVVLITVGLDTIDITSNQGREVGGQVEGSTKVGVVANVSAVLSAVGAIHAGVAVAETRGTTNTETSILTGETESRGAEARSGLGRVLRADRVGDNLGTRTAVGQRGTTRANRDNLRGINGSRGVGVGGQADLKNGIGGKVGREGNSERGKTLTSHSNGTRTTRDGNGRESGNRAALRPASSGGREGPAGEEIDTVNDVANGELESDAGGMSQTGSTQNREIKTKETIHTRGTIDVEGTTLGGAVNTQARTEGNVLRGDDKSGQLSTSNPGEEDAAENGQKKGSLNGHNRIEKRVQKRGRR